MNVYGMYVEFGRRPGFWVRRRTWGQTCARVTHVGELKGRAPYYGNPEVRMNVHSLSDGSLKDVDTELPCPGTHSWVWIDPPGWCGEGPFDPRAGRVIINVPFAENSKASRLGARWSPLLGAFYLREGDERAIEKATALGFLGRDA